MVKMNRIVGMFLSDQKLGTFYFVLKISLHDGQLMNDTDGGEVVVVVVC